MAKLGAYWTPGVGCLNSAAYTYIAN